MQETAVIFRELVKNIPSTTYGTFALYRYPAKFIPQVIAYTLNRYANPSMTVFDPFAGYGTSGLVSRIYGCEYELWDLNPLLKTFHEISILEPDLFKDVIEEKIFLVTVFSTQLFKFLNEIFRLVCSYVKQFEPYCS